MDIDSGMAVPIGWGWGAPFFERGLSLGLLSIRLGGDTRQI